MADQIVRDNWTEWEDRIETLVLDEVRNTPTILGLLSDISEYRIRWPQSSQALLARARVSA